jgi:hypothetical protein
MDEENLGASELDRVRPLSELEREAGEGDGEEPFDIPDGQVVRLRRGSGGDGGAVAVAMKESDQPFRSENQIMPTKKQSDDDEKPAKEGGNGKVAGGAKSTRAAKPASGGKTASRRGPAASKADDDGGDFAVEEVHACTVMMVPPALQGDAEREALEERADNAEPHHSGAPVMEGDRPLAGLKGKLWKPGRTLRVRFLDNPPKRVREQIEKYAHQWEQFANIKFSFGNDPNAEIRITCTPGKGSWSYLGTDALAISRSKPTMNYGWFTEQTEEKEFSRTTLHEFGHALGFIHEHMSPAGNIPWNRPAAYRYYTSTQGWPKQQVDSQIFGKYAASQTNASAYDPTSIMHYPVPKELTTDGFEVGWNTALSENDKAFTRKLYPA